ncbi:hypothetical protein ACIP2Y_44435 [Streptomyces sviceus]|uniref:hypothetical protein n=1 Tax=Streptomyces sviceus TaxID=285530 RepID=UPI0038094A06
MVIETVVRGALRRRAGQCREEWEGAGDARAPANGFRRRRLGLGPVRPQEDGADSETAGVQLMIDARTDTYEQAVAAPGRVRIQSVGLMKLRRYTASDTSSPP